MKKKKSFRLEFPALPDFVILSRWFFIGNFRQMMTSFSTYFGAPSYVSFFSSSKLWDVFLTFHQLRIDEKFFTFYHEFFKVKLKLLYGLIKDDCEKIKAIFRRTLMLSNFLRCPLNEILLHLYKWDDGRKLFFPNDADCNISLQLRQVHFLRETIPITLSSWRRTKFIKNESGNPKTNELMNPFHSSTANSFLLHASLNTNLRDSPETCF